MILILATIVFLFSLFIFGKDDFVLLRKNVSLTAIFDMAFFVGIGGLFLSRIIYVATHFSSTFFNPLVFFIIPYFPGLSGAGLLLGAAISLYAITMQKKFPLGKVFDIFTSAFLSASAFLLLEQAVSTLFVKNYLYAAVLGGSGVILFCILFLLLRFASKLLLSDGSLALIGMGCVAAAGILVDFAFVQFRSIPQEFYYFLFIFLLIFVSFLIKTLKRAKQHV